MKKIALIGSTGSIGIQTLNVVRRYPEEFKIISLAAGKNSRLLSEQVNEFKPKIATLENECDNLSKDTEYFFGKRAYTNAICAEADIVVIALVGFEGIIAVLDAIDKGKDIALANKESLVVGGELVMKRAKERNVKILPVDSEHSAVWQALGFDFEKKFKRIILTASGGAFRDKTEKELVAVKAADALKHPNWNMGAKITVDCATLVNKGFEVVEAKWLYNAPFEKIDVIIHRQSIIHSMVEYDDGSVIAQMSYPTMELPISLALTYPKRLNQHIESLNFSKIGTLTFEELDRKKFPCFEVVIDAAKKGGVYPALVNGANDYAVDLFLKDKISFFDIYKAIKGVCEANKTDFDGSIESLLAANEYAHNYVKNLFGV